MPDNVTKDGETYAFDQVTIGGVAAKVARNKIGFGADGTYTEVTADAPFPVEIISGGVSGGGGGDASAANQATEIARLTSILGSVDGIEALIVATNALLGGTLTVGLPTGAATQATLASVLAKLIDAPATEAKQDAVKASVDALAPYLDGVEGLLTVLTNAVNAPSGAQPLPVGAATQATLALTAPADDLFAITPSDSVALATIPKALLVTADGNVAVRGTGSSPVTLAVKAGQLLPIRARYVYATATTATVVGLV